MLLPGAWQQKLSYIRWPEMAMSNMASSSHFPPKNELVMSLGSLMAKHAVAWRKVDPVGAPVKIARKWSS